MYYTILYHIIRQCAINIIYYITQIHYIVLIMQMEK